MIVRLSGSFRKTISINKNDNFQMKNCDIQVFLIFAQNIDCGYTLEPPQ